MHLKPLEGHETDLHCSIRPCFCSQGLRFERHLIHFRSDFDIWIWTYTWTVSELNFNGFTLTQLFPFNLLFLFTVTVEVPVWPHNSFLHNHFFPWLTCSSSEQRPGRQQLYMEIKNALRWQYGWEDDRNAPRRRLEEAEGEAANGPSHVVIKH